MREKAAKAPLRMTQTDQTHTQMFHRRLPRVAFSTNPNPRGSTRFGCQTAFFQKSIKRRFDSPYCNLDRELQQETSATLHAYPKWHHSMREGKKKEAYEGENI